MSKVELERLLSKRSIASRKVAAQLILSGKVKVNGRVCRVPLEFFHLNSKIEVMGVEVISVKKHYLMLNKPKGVVVTRSDELGRPTVYECLKDWTGPLLQAVGRLDLASEGLLFFTNDHEWANKLTDPCSHIKKIYHVQISSIPPDEVLQKLSNGIIIDGYKTLPSKFEILRTGEKNCWVSVELSEGKNRQIRKMFESEQIEVLRLIRVQVGLMKLDDLPKGKWREISEQSV